MKRVLGYAMNGDMVEVSLNLGGLNQLASVSCALQLQGNEKSKSKHLVHRVGI